MSEMLWVYVRKLGGGGMGGGERGRKMNFFFLEGWGGRGGRRGM